MPPEPRAYFLTWHTYGTRLHGHAEGSVDNKHNQFARPRLPPDAQLHASRERDLAFPPLILCEPSRTIVHQAIEDHARHRGWFLHALNVRTTHVHAVVTAPGRAPEAVMDQFKQWGTGRLREAGLLAADRPTWAIHGSTRYIWEEPGLPEAIHYVLHCQ